ncbi:DUF4294 domain-containing protein [Chitinophaga barathri]|uniref:DUF4294 domain-containing protein n=1 Tax=Chitinophaga barathri TaxID=1647451 RepID=UPI001F4DADD2|nr:DUF4294 domain-containing protein [Chitinophaga barathri]
MLRYSIILSICILCLAGSAAAQQRTATDTVAVRAVLYGNDTIPSITLHIFDVTDKLPRRLRKQRERWTRLRNAVYVTYPYAVSAGRILKDVNRDLKTFSSKKERKEYLASKEKLLKAEFGDKLENLSVYQGKVLMKLIHRETGENCYDIVKELKGGFNARMYQTVAFFFGGNLKSEFNSQDDKDIELIVQEIQLYNRFN